MFAVFLLCVLRARYDLLLDTKGLWITHHQVRAFCETESNVQCTGMACGSSGTNTPPDEGSQIYIHVPTQCTLVWLV